MGETTKQKLSFLIEGTTIGRDSHRCCWLILHARASEVGSWHLAEVAKAEPDFC
jgi:hypothetical protein